MSLSALPLFLRLAGRPVILTGTGEAAEAKRRLLERAGAAIVGEENHEARIAIVADGDADTAARLKARGILVNVTDRGELCDFTLPAIVARDPVVVAVGTGGVSAGVAAALRQRLETLLPANLGEIARRDWRGLYPGMADRRRAIATAISGAETPTGLVRIALRSADPDDLTLREARLLGQADRLYHHPDIAEAILARARTDAPRIACDTPPEGDAPGLFVYLEIAR